MARNLRSRQVLITGAGSGLGRGLAEHLAASGHRLFLLDRDRDSLLQTVRALPDPASCLRFETVDVSSEPEVVRFAASIQDARVDVLVNNAGLQQVAPIEDLSVETWDRLMAVMLRGPFLLSKAFLPRMRQHGFGRIIQIGSIHSLVGSPFKAPYTAAKHGLLGLSKVMALETGSTDVTVNTICPAYVRTPLVEKQIQAQALSHNISEEEVVDKIMLEPMPKKVFITIEEIAAAVEFLMSHEARNITGQTIVIDGGWTAR